MMQRVSDVQRTEIDGVPVFYVDTPGPMTGALTFRVGQGDETLIGRGITHVIEHLALAPVVAEHRASNGRVAMTITLFEAEGEPEELGGFFTHAARSLSELDYDRLETERRVLRTEDRRRGGSLGALAHGLRFGPAGYGLVDFPELGLFGATPETIEAWRTRWFTRGNAALWLSGPPPDNLDLSALPEGELIPPPRPEPLPYKLPAWYPAADSYIAVSLLAPRGNALWMAGGILQERLYERLRSSEGRSYEVSVGYDPMTAHDASLLIVVDTLPEEAESVRDALSVELHKFARSGATEEELAEVMRLRERAGRDPRAPIGAAEHHALETLFGGTPIPRDQLDRDLAALTGDEVGAALREALGSALWLVPSAIGVYDRRVRPLPNLAENAVEGRAFPRPRGVPDDLEGDVLVVGADGVSVTDAEGGSTTVLAAHCRALQVYDDGARLLWASDSVRLFVHPAVWEDGEEAIAAIDALVDAELHVQTGEPSGYEPPIDPEKQAAGAGLLRRWRRR
jgi:hypothetical protein